LYKYNIHYCRWLCMICGISWCHKEVVKTIVGLQ